MSDQAKTAVLQEALDQSFWWRTWAALKHGLPAVPPRNVIAGPPAAAAANAVTSTVTQAAGAVATKAMPIARAALLAALTAAGGVGVGGAGAWLLGAFNHAPATVVETPGVESSAVENPAATSADTLPVGGDLLGWLRQNGYNLPPTAEGAK